MRSTPFESSLLAVVLVITAALPLTRTELAAQDGGDPPITADTAAPGADGLSVTAALGTATGEMIAAAFSGQSFSGRTGWGLRVALNEEFVIFGPRPARSVWDLSVLRLWRTSPAPGVFVAFGGLGLGLTGGMERGAFIGRDEGWFGSEYYEEEPFSTVGVAVSAGATVAPFRVIGIGLGAHGNVNPQRSYVAGTLTLSIGKLRH